MATVLLSGSCADLPTGHLWNRAGARALQASQAALAGTFQPPDLTPRPAAKGKKIAVVSAGQAGISSAMPANAVLEAAKVIGWNVTLYDGKLDPRTWPGLVDMAVHSGVAAIVLVAVDCPVVAPQLREAKARDIKVVPVFSFDCDDPLLRSGPSLFSGTMNFGAPVNQDLGGFSELYGADQATAVIASTGGNAKVILFEDSQFVELRYVVKGFKKAIAGCGTCSIVAEKDLKAAELGPTALKQVSEVLAQHPEANAVKSPDTAATLLAIGPAVMRSGRANSLYAMGGEGYEPEMDLIRRHQGLSALTVLATDWLGWAGVDTLNSLFQGRPIARCGLGWQLIDDELDPPPATQYTPNVNFRAAYRKAWGLPA